MILENPTIPRAAPIAKKIRNFLFFLISLKSSARAPVGSSSRKIRNLFRLRCFFGFFRARPRRAVSDPPVITIMWGFSPFMAASSFGCFSPTALRTARRKGSLRGRNGHKNGEKQNHPNNNRNINSGGNPGSAAYIR